MILRQDLRQQAAVIFDFDGTVALGHGPVRAYADAIPAERLANSAAFAEQVEVALAELDRSEEHTSELQSRFDLVCRLLLEKKKKTTEIIKAQDRHQETLPRR